MVLTVKTSLKIVLTKPCFDFVDEWISYLICVMKGFTGHSFCCDADLREQVWLIFWRRVGAGEVSFRARVGWFLINYSWTHGIWIPTRHAFERFRLSAVGYGLNQNCEIVINWLQVSDQSLGFWELFLEEKKLLFCSRSAIFLKFKRGAFIKISWQMNK